MIQDSINICFSFTFDAYQPGPGFLTVQKDSRTACGMGLTIMVTRAAAATGPITPRGLACLRPPVHGLAVVFPYASSVITRSL